MASRAVASSSGEVTLQSCGVGVPAALITFLWGDPLGTQATGKQSLQACPPPSVRGPYGLLLARPCPAQPPGC